jgi:hypothetical protein
MLHECRTADDVRALAKEQSAKRRAIYNAPRLEPEPCKFRPPVYVAPEPEPVPAPEPFIPPAPMLVPEDFIVNGTIYQSGPILRQIIKAVAERYGVTPLDIVSDRRTMNVCRPRQIAMYLARTLTTRSLPYIGTHMGGRDHTTVLHSVNKIIHLRAIDPELDAQITELEFIFKPPAAE